MWALTASRVVIAASGLGASIVRRSTSLVPVPTGSKDTTPYRRTCGEIQDEYDEEEPMIVRLSDHEARVDGRAAVDDLQELFDTTFGLEDEDEYDTVGGLIYHRIGGVPKPGDQVSVDGLTLTVESTDGRRVSKVLVVRTRPDDGGDHVADDEADR